MEAMEKEERTAVTAELIPRPGAHGLGRPPRTGAPAPLRILARAPDAWRRWQRGDPGQAGALRRVLAFFGLMLLLTLIARGTAGAAMATVTMADPTVAVLTQSLRLEGTVYPAARFSVGCPAAVPVAEVLVRAGQGVQAGEAVVRLDGDTGEHILAETTARRGQLRAQRQALLQSTPVSDAALQAAQLAARYAQEDRDRVWADPEASEEARRAADRSLEQAQLNLAQANESYAQSVQQAGQQQAADRASAAVLAAELDTLEADLAALTALRDAGWVLTAGEEGTVREVLCTAGQTAEGVCLRLDSARDGYLLELPLDGEAAERLQAGQTVEVEQGGTRAAVRIAAIADDEARQLTATAPLAAPFAEGSATAVVTLSSTRYESCIPLGALRRDSGGAFVYTVQTSQTLLGLQNVVVRQPVTVLETDGATAALGGFGGERVVVTASRAIAAGDKVRLAE